MRNAAKNFIMAARVLSAILKADTGLMPAIDTNDVPQHTFRGSRLHLDYEQDKLPFTMGFSRLKPDLVAKGMKKWNTKNAIFINKRGDWCYF